MNKDELRSFCLSFPGATEQVQWEYDLLFKVGGKMFLVTNLEPAEITGISFKCTPESFAELIERPGIEPNKYLARAHWISVRELTALKRKELESLIRESYQLVFDKLTKKLQREIASAG